MQYSTITMALALAAGAAAQTSSGSYTIEYWTQANCRGNAFLHATNDSSNVCEPLEKGIRSANVVGQWAGHTFTLYTDANCNSAPISPSTSACNNGNYAAYKIRTN